MKKLLLKKSALFISLFILSLSSSRAFAYDVIVAKDGTGNFTTIAAAISAAPTGRTTPYTIFIKNGKYREKDTIPSNKPFIQMVGESVANVIISWDDFSGKAIPGGGTYGTGNSATVTVNAPDFTAINITFENTTGEQPQALAINVVGDRAAFKNCRFLGGQDTVFAGGNGARQYFNACYIDGTVDFIFGDARAVFDSTVIYAKTRSSAGASYITAANTKQTEPYGYVFRNCVIPANRGGTVYYLGRPWQNDASTADAAKSYNKVVYINTTMSSAVQSVGWSTWDAGTDVTKITFAEYRSKKFDSSLVDVSQRVSWSKQLSAAEAANYSNANLFGTWDPCSVSAGFCDYTPRPIAVSNFKGVKGASTSTFTWNISWPMTGIKYEVLRSNDKTNFTVINQQTAVNDSTVNFGYNENVPPPGVTYYYILRASKSGLATHITDTVTISSTPTITVTGAMGGFLQGLGTPSAAQSYVVAASSLTNNLIITAPAAYELSTNGSTWNTSSNPLVFTQDANGNVANTTIFVRLNATVAGTYNGNIIHASQGADSVKLAVTGTVQSTPLTVSDILQWYPMAVNATDSASVRSAGIAASTPTLSIFSVSDGVSYDGAAIPAYSSTNGQALSGSPGGTGDWRTASGGPGGNLTHVHYEQFTVTSAAGYTAKIDSLILNNSFYLSSSNTKLAVQYSLSGFATDSSEVSAITAGGTTLTYVSSGGFVKAVALPNENGPTTYNLRIALNGSTGIAVPAGQTLSVRLYFSCGSSSRNRYAKIKDLMFKGLSTKNPVTGDYRTHQTGVWSDVNTWERFDGTNWVNPAPEFPHFSNTTGTIIQNGHTVTLGSTFSEGFGYIPKRTQINKGGQLVVNAGANLNLANDNSIPAAATTDLQIDGTLTVNGGIFTNSNVAIAVNGTFINASTSMNLSNTNDTVFVGSNGMWEQRNNSSNTPLRFSFEPTSTFKVTGLTSAQTGLFKNNVKYGNIIWNNTSESAYYAVRTTLDSSNVKGSFTVQSTGTTYLSFANSSARTSFPGGYYQTGGTVNFREGNNVIDTLDLGGDFSVTGGNFISNAPLLSSLLIRLNGVNKTINYNQTTATNTNWSVGGIYNLGSNLNLASAGFGMNVSGSLDAGTNVISGAGDFALLPGAVFSSGSATGLDGNITATGTKAFSNTATYIFNGTVAQTTGALLPATVGSLTINNSNDVTLSSSVNVTNALTLTAGHLMLMNNNVTASSVLGSSSAKYVVTNGTGMLKVNSIGAGTNVFPVGTSITSYSPVTLNNAGIADNFSVSVKNTVDNALPNPNAIVNKQWTISEETAGGSNVTVSLAWVIADQASGFSPASATSILRWTGTAWEARPATITGAGTTASPYVATASGFTAFSPFIVANDIALPLNLLTFNAGYVNANLNVWWSTTNEVNTASFAIERSVDGRTFNQVGAVTAKNIATQNSYTFIDANPVSGISYYRLKVLDKDGASKYSQVVIINTKLRGLLSVYPNPVINMMSVTHSKAGKNATIEIVSINGRKVFTQKLYAGATQTSLDVSGLASGSYTVVLNDGNEKSSIAFVKQ